MSTQHARLPDGASAGHWTDARGQTGCTVLLVPGGAVAGVDVRGGAPGTINTDGLRPGTVTERAHAILLTGGSTFGLSAAMGVLRYLEERGIGLMFGPVAVPIVAGAVIFDLLAGDPAVRPGPDAGYAVCEAASASPAQGTVGAGTGASVAKAGGNEPRPGGVVLLRITGTDIGEFGEAPMQVLNDYLRDKEPVRLFIDARAVRGASIEVSIDERIGSLVNAD